MNCNLSYLNSLPKELRDLLRHYQYYDNLQILIEIFGKIEKPRIYVRTLRKNRSFEGSHYVRILKSLLQPFNIICSFSIKSDIVHGYKYTYDHLEIDIENIITKDILVEILSNKTLLYMVAGNGMSGGYRDANELSTDIDNKLNHAQVLEN